MGPRLVAVLGEVKPAVKALLEAEYARVGYDPSAASSKTTAAGAAGGGAGGGGSCGLPRQVSDSPVSLRSYISLSPPFLTYPLCCCVGWQDLFGSGMLDKGTIVAELSLTEGKTSWQNRKNAIEAVIAACERSGHYLEVTPGAPAVALVDLLKALKARLNDTQANLKPLAAAAIGHLIASLEPEAGAKHLRPVAGGLVGGLGDNKKPMRDATVAALNMAVSLNRYTTSGADGASSPPSSSVVEVGLLAVLIGPLCEALVATAVGRQELLSFLLPLAAAEPLSCLRHPVDCTEMPAPLVLAMQDKTAAVRSLAEQLLGVLTARALVSRQSVEKATRDLAPAAKRTVMPSVERMLAAYGMAKKNGTTAATAATSTATTATTTTVAAATVPVISEGAEGVNERVGGVSNDQTAALTASASVVSLSAFADHPLNAPSSPSSSSSALPGFAASSSPTATAPLGDSTTATTNAAPAVASSSSSSSVPSLLKRTVKAKRLADGWCLQWPQPPEDPSDAELAALRTVWEPLMTADLAALVFPSKGGAAGKFGQLTNQDACLAAVSELTNQVSVSQASVIALQHSDLLVRYACHALCLRETAGGMLKVLGLVGEIFSMLKREGQMLHDSEVSCLLPHLIDRAGHKSERHKAAFKAVLVSAADVMPPSKLCQALLQVPSVPVPAHPYMSSPTTSPNSACFFLCLLVSLFVVVVVVAVAGSVEQEQEVSGGMSGGDPAHRRNRPQGRRGAGTSRGAGSRRLSGLQRQRRQWTTCVSGSLLRPVPRSSHPR